jgi:hypothetical protein
MGSRKLRKSAVSDTAYHGLIGGDGAESNFESLSRSDHRSTSEEHALSLASMQTSTEAGVRDGMVLDPVTESFFLGGDVSGGAGLVGGGSRDRLERVS